MEPETAPDASSGPMLATVLDRLDAIARRLDRLGPDAPDGSITPAADPIAHRRPFTLLDLMILVAFTALAMPAYRLLPGTLENATSGTSDWLQRVIVYLLILWAYVTPVAVVLTLAISVLRRIGPRPAHRPLDRQAGAFGASVATLLLITVVPLHLLITAGLDVSSDPDDYVLFGLIGCSKVVGGAVAGIWLTLRVSGRFDRAVDWVDGFGRALCIFWLTAGTLNMSLF